MLKLISFILSVFLFNPSHHRSCSTNRPAYWTSTGLPSRTLRFVLVFQLSSLSLRVCMTKLATSFDHTVIKTLIHPYFVLLYKNAEYDDGRELFENARSISQPWELRCRVYRHNE